MMKKLLFPLLQLFFACLILLPAVAQSTEIRVALVIGNGAYQFNTTLKNPVNDAQAVAKALKEAGFTSVVLLKNATRPDMEKAVRDFGNALKNPQAIGLFFYSGHGAQSEGSNFLIPIDADIQEADELRYKAVDAEQVLAKMRSSGNKLNMVFLDACRNAPFPGATKSGDKGLAMVKVEVPESVIMYATSPGSTAQDGAGGNSPFTMAFLKHMKTPGQDISIMAKLLIGSVKQATGGTQTPWLSSNLSKDFSFVPAAQGQQPVFGTIAKATGSLEIVLDSKGSVSLLGKTMEVPAGGLLPVTDIPAGPLSVSVLYEDGHSELREITIGPNQTVTLHIGYITPKKIQRGLSVYEPRATDWLVSSATSAGETAQDGTGRNGLYTGALLKFMDMDSQIESLLANVAEQVRRESKGAMTPEFQSRLTQPMVISKPDTTGGKKYCALVIGNSNYEQIKLNNPLNDAKDVAARLKSFGWEVLELHDAGRKDILQALKTMENRISSNQHTAVLVFLSGFGVQVDSTNYFIPTGETLETEHDVRTSCIPVDHIMNTLRDRKADPVLMFLDISKDNPFSSRNSR